MSWSNGPGATTGNDSFLGTDTADVANGLAGNDTLSGAGGNDSLIGNFGLDSLIGGEGNDTLAGYLVGSGDGQSDTLIGGAGGDYLYGGDFTDWASYATDTAGVTVDLGLTGAQTGGEAAGDTLVGVGNLLGGSGADSLVGNGNSNRLIGGDGNDTIAGRASGDTIEGGVGNDWASYSLDAAGVTIDLAVAAQNSPGNGFQDSLTGIENVEGGAGNDSLLGDGGANILAGGAGSDSLTGGAGADTLIGGAAVIGGDWALYTTDAAGVEVDLNRAVQVGGQAAGDSLSGIEAAAGGTGNDTLTGTDAANSLVGANGNDLLAGGAGVDSLVGGEGDDTVAGGAGGDNLQGGTGIDLLDYSASAAAVSLNLIGGFQVGGQAQGDVLSADFERVIGTAGADTITGYVFSDTIEGGEGNDSLLGGGGVVADSLVGGGGDDTLFGDDGADTLVGGEGNDTLRGFLGNDSVDGGAGFDFWVAPDSGALLSISLDINGDGLASVPGGIGDVGLDTLRGIEGIVSGNAADTIVAAESGSPGIAANNLIITDSGNDSVLAGAGNDTVLGEFDQDTIDGGTGDDSLLGGFGNDSLVGGTGNDILAGEDNEDRLSGGAGLDTLDGGAANDTLEGGTENDRLLGGTGNDSLLGDAGNDTLLGGDNEDRLFGGDDADTLDGGTGNDTLDGGLGNDSLFGGDGADTLLGGDGADTLNGGALGVADRLDFGLGDDTHSYVLGTGNDTLLGGTGSADRLFLPGWVGPSIDTDTVANGTYGSWTVSGTPGVDALRTFTNGTTVLRVGDWESVVCFAAGTRIMTPGGEVPVERLRVGDDVLALRQGGARIEPIRWIGRRAVDLRRHARPAEAAPVLIRAGALGGGVPHRDLLVSPEHALFLDGALVPARLLVDGQDVVQQLWRAEVVYLHVELEEHALLVAEGALAESYLDDGNRHLFANGAAMTRFTGFDAGRDAGGYDRRACAPVLRDPWRIAALRASLGLGVPAAGLAG